MGELARKMDDSARKASPNIARESWTLRLSKIWEPGQKMAAGAREAGPRAGIMPDPNVVFEKRRESVRDQMRAGFNLVRQLKFAEAIEEYDKALHLWPENPKICLLFFDRAKAETNIGRCNEALVDLRKAKKKGYVGPRLYYERGRAHLYRKTEGENGDGERRRNARMAIENFDKAETMGYSDLYLFFYRARAKMTVEDFSRAMGDVNRLIPNGAGEPRQVGKLERWAYLLRGRCKRKLLDYDGALLDLAEAEKHEYNNPYVHSEKAKVYRSLGRHQEAIDEFRKAISLDHPNARLGKVVSELEELLRQKKDG